MKCLDSFAISACLCHPDYSTSQICDQNSGNCTCTNPMIPLSDRTCGQCIRGYGDFPNCKGKIFTVQSKYNYSLHQRSKYSWL